MDTLPQSNQLWLRTAALSGAAAVGLGAFGSHGLRHSVPDALLAVWHTAVEYQFVHTLALLCLALLGNEARFRWTMRLWAAGILLFSGSLYALVLTGTRRLGIITPMGGLCFIAGWLVLAFTVRLRPSAHGE